MSKIMLQMITLCFECIIILIFYFPAGAPTINNYIKYSFCLFLCFTLKRMICDKCVVVNLFSAFPVCYCYFNKIYQKCVFSIPQWDCFHIFVSINLMIFPIKPVNNFFFCAFFYPLIDGFM